MYINELWTQTSRQWMYNANRRSMEFIDGMHEFIEAAKKHKYNSFFRCPYKFCRNEKDYSSSRTIHSHLFNSGCWRFLCSIEYGFRKRTESPL
jgi:hypothetical protein